MLILTESAVKKKKNVISERSCLKWGSRDGMSRSFFRSKRCEQRWCGELKRDLSLSSEDKLKMWSYKMLKMILLALGVWRFKRSLCDYESPDSFLPLIFTPILLLSCTQTRRQDGYLRLLTPPVYRRGPLFFVAVSSPQERWRGWGGWAVRLEPPLDPIRSHHANSFIAEFMLSVWVCHSVCLRVTVKK